MFSSVPKIMGILNVTPDSFYDRGKFNEVDKAILGGIHMYRQGADIIDIGGESARPGASEVSEEDEMARVIPVVRALSQEISVPLSIDTRKPRVAQAALMAGASLINDVSGFRDPDMIAVAAEADVPICLMHMLGTPKNMQDDPFYEEGVVPYLIRWFSEKVQVLSGAGIKKKNIILDPGIGFGKTVDDNLEIIHNLPRLKAIGFPVLVGVSRKSFMSKILNKPASDTLAATIAMNAVSLLMGADIIRVHDVTEHRDIVDVLKRFASINKIVEAASSNDEFLSAHDPRS